jgi:hypothetical protein
MDTKKMMNRKVPMITDLSEEERKSVEERLKLLQAAMRYCEGYLRDYAAGGQNAIKFLNTVACLHGEVKESAKTLVKVHDLPDFPGFSNL